LVVWKLDRLGRSLQHLIATLNGLQERGIGFISLKENTDTTTPGGKLIFHVMGALADFSLLTMALTCLFVPLPLIIWASSCKVYRWT
jgi:hypothetical protein